MNSLDFIHPRVTYSTLSKFIQPFDINRRTVGYFSSRLAGCLNKKLGVFEQRVLVRNILVLFY